MKASSFFTKEQAGLILGAIKEAELNTSGEIRVHIETKLSGDVLDRAAWIFAKLGMYKTAARNGVLIYLAVESRQFAIIGDAGINSRVGVDFWNNTKALMEKRFQQGEFAEGLRDGILMAGEQLKTHFPYNREDVNELTDDISFGSKV